MTNDEEEQFIVQQLKDAQHRLRVHVREDSNWRIVKNQLEAEVARLEIAALDYMKGNGLLETEHLSIRKTRAVDVPDIEAVPEQFVREKIVREPNKLLIRELAPEGNWYIMTENESVILKGEKA